jgi:ArsR family transcriptional regulator
MFAMFEPVRWNILRLLAANGPMRVFEIHQALKAPQPTISHHLKILFEAGFLTKELVGHGPGSGVHYQIVGGSVRALAAELVKVDKR